ncbi:tyrosine-type recombinase/integrase [Sphaerospermopsis aphanizomenoides BCCUSP55]|uniref:tyrosine-type recombinase/integrase n=1 Tax=Sphaerospermopsis aphanizomenoides TaxID=459663 RepID=UPI0019042ADB|nr:tyrosine-type recombinase/integrase [Sphaerospermopsis aphanizomenoides]MBK1990995.1 tyrosine-type recombinase/integrase [Sphaerospermopsis aphanizomenoides BCCUSP55]
MKISGFGEAATLSDTEYLKIRRNIRTPKYRILLDLAWYTGERWGALVQLRVSDVYHADGTPRTTITFRAATRKKRPDGSAETRQIPTHPNLLEALRSYTPDTDSSWLFPSRDGETSITWRNAYDILKRSVEDAGLATKGISTHSTRRSFITNLHRKGVSTPTIKKITGHKDYKSLERYIDINADEVKGAIFAL